MKKGALAFLVGLRWSPNSFRKKTSSLL